MAKITQPTRPLAEVNALPQDDGSHRITVGFLSSISPFGDETFKACLAVDGSRSMRETFGFGCVPFKTWPNCMEMVARKLGVILSEFTSSGTTTVIYWAVGPDGSKIEEVGEFDATGWEKAPIKGPTVEKWGQGTKLLPAIRYVVENVAQNSNWTWGAILTDGIIEDEEECFAFCRQVGRKFSGKWPEPVKLVFFGIGEQVDGDQLERFEDIFEGTGIDYNLFSFRLVSEISEEWQILDPFFPDMNLHLMDMGRVEDSKGNVLINWSDGVPGKFEFILPKGETQFVIKLPGVDIFQDVSEAIS